MNSTESTNSVIHEGKLYTNPMIPNYPKHWQDEDLWFRYHNDARFNRFVQEIISHTINRGQYK